jgi:hypothetical protein
MDMARTQETLLRVADDFSSEGKPLQIILSDKQVHAPLNKAMYHSD